MADYVSWMRSEAARIGNRYADFVVEGAGVAMMRGRLEESHSDIATGQFSIQVCTSGDYRLTADLGAGRFTVRRREGDAVVGPPGVDLRLSGGSKAGIEITILAIDADRVTSMVEEATGRSTSDLGVVHGGIIRDHTIKAIVQSAWAELSRPNAFTRLQADAVVQMSVLALLRLRGEARRVEQGGLAPWQVDRVMELLNEKYNQEISIAELAAAVRLSRWHFSRAFRKSVGVPPHRRQVELRVERAKQALAEGRLSLAEIALEVGYSSQQTFTRIFRDMTGTTPRAFRRLARS